MHSNDPNFSTTNWSMVLAAVQNDPTIASAALERLCARYWYPVYAFARQRGHDSHSAEDMAQSFFLHLLERQAIQQVAREKGRFRTFLLTALTNFMHNERDKQQAQKRGGGRQLLALDHEDAEILYAMEASNGGAPEVVFEKRWAGMLVRRVLEELRAEHAQRGKGEFWDALQPWLTGEPAAADYEKIAQVWSMDPGAVKVSLHRLRRRFGELLRREVAHTVESPEEVDAELRHLLAAIAE